jgi:hypothetical protein
MKTRWRALTRTQALLDRTSEMLADIDPEIRVCWLYSSNSSAENRILNGRVKQQRLQWCPSPVKPLRFFLLHRKDSYEFVLQQRDNN